MNWKKREKNSYSVFFFISSRKKLNIYLFFKHLVLTNNIIMDESSMKYIILVFGGFDISVLSPHQKHVMW